MKATENNNGNRTGSRVKDYPELQVGFPERNDCMNPSDMERFHVDFETLDISRTNLQEFTKEITTPAK
jgi:hypothetical protein